MTIHSKYLELNEIQEPSESKSRGQLLQWAVGEMAEQIYKDIREDYKTKSLRITLWIETDEGGAI